MPYSVLFSRFNLALIALALILSGCGKSTVHKFDSVNGSQSLGAGNFAIEITDAATTQCAAGGKIYRVFVDLNNSLTIDGSETALSEQVVCNGVNGTNGSDGADGSDGANGTNGSDGYSTVFSLTRVDTNLEACEAGSGLQINSGLDTSRNTTLEPSEIQQSQILCDGRDGAVGAAGPAGSNGHGLVFQTTAAPGSTCPAGGKIIMMATDTNDNGQFEVADSDHQSITLCNGENGTNGADGAAAPVPAYSPVEPIMPCGNTVAYKEVLLRLSNGQVLASFSENVQGLMTRLTLIPDGSYMDTDNSQCTFTLSTSGSTRSISWFGSVQKSWPYNP